MKKLLILVYVLVVASLSISARAESDIPLAMDSVHYNEKAQSLQIKGQYPNPCIAHPLPILSENQKGQLVLELVGQSTADFCIQIVGPQYILAVDLNVLKNKIAELGLDEDAIHQIYDSRGKLILSVDFSKIFRRISFEPTDIAGLLLADEDGLYMDGPLGTRIKVKSALEELKSLQNQEVVLTGHMMNHSVSRPLFNSKTAAPKFIVTGVSFSIAD